MCAYVIVSNGERMCVYSFLRTTYACNLTYRNNYISTYKHMCVCVCKYLWCPRLTKEEMEEVILSGNQEFL